MKLVKIFFVTLFSFFLLLIIGYQVGELTLKKLDEEARENFDGNFIKTELGTLCYKFHGPKDGEIILLIHGWSYPKNVFDNNIQALTRNGFRVLTFDHFGRGCSDRPRVTYDKNFYEKEVLGLINGLNIKSPFYILGYSMGGAVATTFTSRHPDKVKKLILINPTGAGPSIQREQQLLLVPILGPFLMSYFGKASVIKGIEEEFKKGHLTFKMSISFKKQFDYRGTIHAFTSCLKNFVSKSQVLEYKKITNQKVPVQLIWADNDEDVEFKGHEVVQRHIPGIVFNPINGFDHGVLYSHPHLVNKVILDFLN